MIVCSCNVFTDDDVRSILDAPHPPCRARDVYAALGHAPRCGRCAETITAIINSESRATEPEQDKGATMEVAA